MTAPKKTKKSRKPLVPVASGRGRGHFHLYEAKETLRTMLWSSIAFGGYLVAKLISIGGNFFTQQNIDIIFAKDGWFCAIGLMGAGAFKAVMLLMANNTEKKA